MVWFDEAGTDGMPKAAYERYSNLWEDAVAFHQVRRLRLLLAAGGRADGLASAVSFFYLLATHSLLYSFAATTTTLLALLLYSSPSFHPPFLPSILPSFLPPTTHQEERLQEAIGAYRGALAEVH